MNIWSCFSCILGFTFLIFIVGAANILRSLYFKSDRIWIIYRSLAVCIVRNILLWAAITMLNTHKTKLKQKFVNGGQLKEIFVLIAYISVNRMFAMLRVKKFRCKIYILSVIHHSGICLALYVIIDSLDRDNILYSVLHQFIIIIIGLAVSVVSISHIKEREFSQEPRNPLEDESLKTEIINTLNKIYPRQYQILWLDLPITKITPVYILETGLSVLLIMDKNFLNDKSLLEIKYVAAHHLVEYYSGYSEIISFLDMGSHLIFFAVYVILIFGHISHLPIFFRYIICYEIHEIATQAKSLFLGCLCGYIEKKLTKKIGKHLKFSSPTINPCLLYTLMKTCRDFSINRKILTYYEYVFYDYTLAERARDMNIKLFSNSIEV